MIRPLLLAAALTGLTAAALPARAETRTLDSGTLVSNFSLDSDVSIETNPELHGKIRVTGDDLSCVRFGPGPIVSATGCGDDLGHLRIEVPDHATVTLNQSGDGAVHIGDIGGALIANVTGSGNLTAGNVHTLVLSVRGSGDVTIESAIGSATLTSDSSGAIRVHNVTGPLRSVQNGSGDLAIGAIDSPAVDVTIDGSGDAVVGKGHIDNLHARLNGSGDLTVGATAETADLQASGGGDIKVAHVNRDVHKSASGGSSINVYNSDVAEFGLGKLAQLAATADDDDTSSSSAIHTHRTSHSSGSGALHFFAGLAVLFILYAIWRTIQRNGGIGPLKARFNRGPGAPPAPSHPGVIAVRDTITRLEGRLARVENYVTTREFDLQRKFRELDKT